MKNFFVVVFAIAVLAGFYFVLNKINVLENELANLRFPSGENMAPEDAETATGTENVIANETPNSAVIPAAIIFDVLSSPVLSPQTKITVTVEKFSRAPDGTLSVQLKAFTNEATAYSALEPRDLFEIVDLQSGQNQRAVKTGGNFGSIPPKSSVSGELTFKTDPAKTKIILQINASAGLKFYEIDFTRRTYKETAIG